MNPENKEILNLVIGIICLAVSAASIIVYNVHGTGFHNVARVIAAILLITGIILVRAWRRRLPQQEGPRRMLNLLGEAEKK